MTTEAPLISSTSAGPLGVAHLPRLWLKILLHSIGRLPEGYRHGEGGFDETLTTNLGLDRDAFVAYIENEKPDYLTLERWVREHATKLDAEAVAAHNAYIRGRIMGTEMADKRRAELGLNVPGVVLASELNDLDDWAGAHARLTGRA